MTKWAWTTFHVHRSVYPSLAWLPHRPLSCTQKNKNSIEDLLLFYNKYLNVGIGEGFLLELVKKCATTHQLQEISAKDTSIIFNQLELEFLAFHHFKSIELAKDYTIIIDSMGHITNFLFKPGFDLAEKEELKKYINNNKILDKRKQMF